MVRLYKVPLLWVLAGLLAALPTNAVAAAGRHVVHDLDVRLDPTGQRLFGHDRMVVSLAPKRLIVRLSPKAQIESLTIGNQAADWAFSEEGLTVPLPASQGKPAVLTLVYSVIFDDAAPRRPVNTDNPGFGVRGTISERGAVLLAGSGWYPQVAEMARTLNLSVTAPAGILAVTSGRLIGHTTAEGKTVSRWQVNRPIGAVSLCAGPYLHRRKEAGGHVAATYFSRQRQHLADAYLSASLKYLSDYSDRFGPYPFDQFAVVENFFPTGYGFPGFTLLGGRVLDLPFIIPTSLRHEIAHCWWGNGVRVDTSQGNWCEGLVTYVADYAYRAEQGAAAARDYRRQLLRNFTSLVNPGEAIALNRFQSRRDRITKAVGYDKSAFVFHMLHQRLGGGFWQALTDLFRDRCFQEASWTVLASYFQRYADHNLDRFFDQWLARRDAPRLRLEAVAFDPGAGELTGRLVQNAPTYDLSLDLLVVTAGQRRIERIHITGATQSFRLPLE
ncbi:MAG: M1 family aminopeptidase, partial [Desulfosarcinaceae bacterium]